MPMSSFANDAAWFLLKQSKDDYDLTRLMSEEDQQAAARHSASLSPEKQDAMRQISETFNAMPDEAKGQLTASAHNLMRQYEGRLGEVLPQEGHESGAVTKFFPLVIGVVFALDALNRSQGAKASLVGNVFTDIGNGVVSSSGGPSDMFGETDYGDLIEYENQSSLVNPLTGTQHKVVDDPSMWQRTWMGAASAAGSFVNPFAVLGAGAKGASRGAGRGIQAAGRGVGRTQRAAGQGISRLGASGTQRAGAKAASKGTKRTTTLSRNQAAAREAAQPGLRGISRLGAKAPKSSRSNVTSNVTRPNSPEALSAVGRLDRYGRYVQGKGKGKIDYANTTQAAKTAASKEANQLGNLAGGSRGKVMGIPKTQGLAYRGIQGLGHSGMPEAGAAFAMMNLNNLFNPNDGGGGGDNNMSGGTTGFGTGFGGAGGGINDISNVQGNSLGEKQIWNPEGYRGTSMGANLEQQHQGNLFGGFGIGKGDTMFVNNKGNEIKKEVIKLMYKEKCPKCDKASCTCDDEKKAVCSSCGKMQKMCGCEKKAEKKPAHGMVIVIGSKAGPGPSKDGKREKLDSEKKEK